MQFKLHANEAEFRSLMARLKSAGPKANTIMKTSMARSAKPMVKEWKQEADEYKRTGAMMRSFGTHRMREGVRVGVRYNYQDPETGKIPAKYAAQANRAQGDWFGLIWGMHKMHIPKQIMQELKLQLAKKGF
ncbi:MAG TPA: hypothetical protein PK034_09020 [Rugosibacter sp.]|nr:hypothetical protein [Rugosibacter sp.]